MSLKSIELLPTRENLIETLEKNILGRNQYVWQFASFVDAQDDRCSIAIDSHWGKGKTFFVKHVQLLLESLNEHINISERDRIKKVFEKNLKENNEKDFIPEVCVYYDAWEHDDDEDPILSIIYEIVRKSAREYSLEKKPSILKILKAIVLDIADIKAGGLIGKFKDEIEEGRIDYLAELKEQSELHDRIEEFLKALLPEQGNRLVIFIDELDRCKPSYAVRLLERIKHYFSSEYITFVFSVNISELQHVLRQYYGQGFDGCRYLDRFFDYRLSLPNADMTRYYEELGLSDNWKYDSVCKEVIRYCGFELREIQKFWHHADIAASKLVRTNRTHRMSGTSFEYAVILFVPIIIGLKIQNATRYNEFIAGRDSRTFVEIIEKAGLNKEFFQKLLDPLKERYVKAITGADNDVLLSERLTEVYNALFSDDNIEDGKSTTIGTLRFDKSLADNVLATASFMASFADF